MNYYLSQLFNKIADIDNVPIFTLSILPYFIFLIFLFKNKIFNNQIKIGFSLTILFVLITILFSILSEYLYNKTLVEVDFFHGAAELFLTISDLVILYGFMKLLKTIEVKNS